MNQNLVLHSGSDKHYCASRSSQEIIRSDRNFVEVLAWGTENGSDLYLLIDTNFPPEFYDLSTGLAGEILQKVSNYRVRLAIFGSFEMVKSRKFREFIHETNAGSSVGFFQNRADAEAWLLQ